MLASISFLCKIFENNLWSTCCLLFFLELHPPFDLCALRNLYKMQRHGHCLWPFLCDSVYYKYTLCSQILVSEIFNLTDSIWKYSIFSDRYLVGITLVICWPPAVFQFQIRLGNIISMSKSERKASTKHTNSSFHC